MQQFALPDFDCACATVRRAARLVTQLYDGEMRGKLQASQFALLAAMERCPGVNQAALARISALEKSTLSRNLALMARKGWIEQAVTNDLRERGFHLTKAGRTLLSSAKPDWKRAQKRLETAMKQEKWNTMWEVLSDLTNAVYQMQQERGTKK